MAGRGGRKAVNFSKIYTFACGKSSLKNERSEIGGPGYSRVVYCNDPGRDEAGLRNYAANYVSTTKYTMATFIPKSLFEQFRRVANIYFLLAACLSFTPFSPYSAVSSVLPLLFVIGVTMLKEAVEDWRRFEQVHIYIYLFFPPVRFLFGVNRSSSSRIETEETVWRRSILFL